MSERREQSGNAAEKERERGEWEIRQARSGSFGESADRLLAH